MLDVSRTAALIGDMGVQKLKSACVAVFGIGGVGSYATEALARAGVGTLCLIDNDVVKPSNCNRQLTALDSTIGKKKTDVMAKRVLDINPDINVIVHDVFYDADMSERIFSQKLDFVVDAIDSIRSKESLILECFARKIEMISSMGAGNKLYPERFEVIDIFKTKYDPIAKILRKCLREAGIQRLNVVCSDEQPQKTTLNDEGKQVPASISFVPSVCGLIMAGVAVRYIAGVKA